MQIPFLMVITFLLLTLGGLLRSTNSAASFREYAVGKKHFTTGYLVAVSVATLCGAATLKNWVEGIYDKGLYLIILLSIVTYFSQIVVSRVALRMTPFMGHISMPETLGKVYGNYVRLLSALVSLVSSIFTLLTQMSSMEWIISLCIGKAYVSIIMPLVVVTFILYTIGGIYIVTIADIMQLCAFCIVLPLLYLWLGMQADKSMPEIFSFLQTQEKFQVSSLYRVPITYIVACILGNIIGAIDPHAMHRIYMATNCVQAHNTFKRSAIMNLYVILCITLISVSSFVLKSDLQPNEVWSYIISKLPSFFKGFLTIGVLAMAMATIGFVLHTSAIIFTYDIVTVLIGKETLSDGHQIRLARLVTIGIGIIALLISLCYKNLVIQMWFIQLTRNCISIIVAPFLLAIFGFRSSAAPMLIGMVVGIVLTVVWNIWIGPAIDTDGFFVSMLANGLAILVAHFVLKQIKLLKNKI